MLRRLLGMEPKTLVGKDLAGNSYFQQGEKRLVEFKGSNSADTVSVPHRMWLSFAREDPPTMEELLDRQKRESVLAVKVARLEEEDAKRQAQERAMNLQRQQEEAADLGVIMNEMEKRRKE